MVTSFLPDQGRRRLWGHALQSSSLALSHAPPHAVPLVATEGVVEALDPDGTLHADALRVARGASLLGEEDLRVVLPAAGLLLPRDVVVHRDSFPPKSHTCDSDGIGSRLARGRAQIFRSTCSTSMVVPRPPSLKRRTRFFRWS